MRRLLLVGMCIAGCHLTTYEDDTVPPDATCVYNGAGGVAEIVVHDPYTGQCVSDSTPPPCGDGCPCDPVPVAGAGPDITGEQYSGECYGPCSGLDENDCWADSSCHATYVSYDDYTTGDGVDPTPGFWGCWDITPNTPEDTGQPCADLDDWTCSVTPSCASVYGIDEYGNEMFELCVPQSVVGSGSSGSACGDTTCPSGETCQVSCSSSGSCIEGCVAQSPGDCFGTVTCAVAPPMCPADTYAGVVDGCYTGYCIPASACGPLPCSSLTSGSACAERPDCDAIYVGSDCTCDDSGCTCSSQVFEQCTDGGGGSGSAL